MLHTVAPGDNLWAIASRYGTTPGEIAARNGLADANLIHPGQVLAIPQAGEATGLQPPGYGGDWWGLAQETGAKHGVDPRLVWAVIQAESTGEPLARSGAGAMGLMQLMPDTARWLGVSNPWDPRQNVDGGTRFLRMLLDLFKGDVTLALAGYNAGPGAVQQYGGVPPFDETRLYVRRVREYLAQAPEISRAPAVSQPPEPGGEPVPAEQPAPESAAPPPTEASGAYTVQPGDSLYLIAARTLGDAGLWGRLYEANRDLIGPNPGLIRPGMVLTIPGAPGTAAEPAVESLAEPPGPAAEEPPAAPPAPPPAIPGADEALAWQGRQLAAGNSYSLWCLAFVNQAYQAAGRRVPELGKPSAADSMDTYRAQGRLQPMDTIPPRGAVVFYDRTASNPYGHIVLSNGDGTVSTSGWPGFAGSATVAIDRLNAMLGRPAIGWAVP